jgi:hypothetical protein
VTTWRDQRENFAVLPLSVRRTIMQACFQVIVLPSPRRSPGSGGRFAAGVLRGNVARVPV